MIMLIALGISLFGRAPSLSASAAYEKMQPQANYTLRQFVDGKVEQMRTGQEDIWSIPNNEAHKSQAAYFRIVKRNVQGAFYGMDGKYGKSLNYQEIGIQVSTVLTKQTLTLTDAQGRVLAMQTNDDELQVTLEEGEYHVNVTIFSNTWTRESDGKQEYYRLDAEYMFYVDMSEPYITGTYAEGEEQWVGVGHTVEALDDVSGDIKDFYFIKPDGTLVVRLKKEELSHTEQTSDVLSPEQIYELLKREIDLTEPRVKSGLIDAFVEKVIPRHSREFNWYLNFVPHLGFDKNQYKEIDTFTIDFDSAHEYRAKRGELLRRNQWFDVVVHVYA